MAKFKLEFDGLDELTKRIASVNGNVKNTTEKALRKTHSIVTAKAEESAQKPNLPAKGKYSNEDTLKSLKRNAEIKWVGDIGSVDVGFDISNGGLASIFMIYGTPRYMKNQKMYNAFKGKATLDEIHQAQQDIFYAELRKLGG